MIKNDALLYYKENMYDCIIFVLLLAVLKPKEIFVLSEKSKSKTCFHRLLSLMSPTAPSLFKLRQTTALSTG